MSACSIGVNTIKPVVNTGSWRAAWTMFPFLSFCWLSYAAIFLICALFYYLIGPRIEELGPWFNWGVLGALGGGLLTLGGGLSLITFTAMTGLDLVYPHNRPSITVKFLFPVAVALARVCRVSRNILRTSFIKVNNSLTIAQRKRFKGDRILVLLPHCLQIDVCNRKITNRIENCVNCGRCPVGKLVETGKQNGLTFEVVNGGTLARRRVAEFRPDGIIAVACERDLTLGIQDVHPIPVYGVINDRPNGPCFNTEVDMTLFEEAIRFFRTAPAVQPA
jgi:uncharacterized protein